MLLLHSSLLKSKATHCFLCDRIDGTSYTISARNLKTCSNIAKGLPGMLALPISYTCCSVTHLFGKTNVPCVSAQHGDLSNTSVLHAKKRPRARSHESKQWDHFTNDNTVFSWEVFSLPLICAHFQKKRIDLRSGAESEVRDRLASEKASIEREQSRELEVRADRARALCFERWVYCFLLCCLA